MKLREVCGTDGITYQSKCHLKQARKCQGVNVDVRARGACKGKGPPLDGHCILCPCQPPPNTCNEAISQMVKSIIKHICYIWTLNLQSLILVQVQRTHIGKVKCLGVDSAMAYWLICSHFSLLVMKSATYFLVFDDCRLIGFKGLWCFSPHPFYTNTFITQRLVIARSNHLCSWIGMSIPLGTDLCTWISHNAPLAHFSQLLRPVPNGKSDHWSWCCHSPTFCLDFSQYSLVIKKKVLSSCHTDDLLRMNLSMSPPS